MHGHHPNLAARPLHLALDGDVEPAKAAIRRSRSATPARSAASTWPGTRPARPAPPRPARVRISAPHRAAPRVREAQKREKKSNGRWPRLSAWQRARKARAALQSSRSCARAFSVAHRLVARPWARSTASLPPAPGTGAFRQRRQGQVVAGELQEAGQGHQSSKAMCADRLRRSAPATGTPPPFERPAGSPRTGRGAGAPGSARRHSGRRASLPAPCTASPRATRALISSAMRLGQAAVGAARPFHVQRLVPGAALLARLFALQGHRSTQPLSPPAAGQVAQHRLAAGRRHPRATGPDRRTPASTKPRTSGVERNEVIRGTLSARRPLSRMAS